MDNVKLCSVYYNGVASMTDTRLRSEYGYASGTEDRYWRAGGRSANGYTLSAEQGQQKRIEQGQWFKTRFTDHLQKGWYYQFIVTTQQLHMFMEDIEKFDFIKYKVYQSLLPAVNSNYPDEGPRLHTFLFYIPEE